MSLVFFHRLLQPFVFGFQLRLLLQDPLHLELVVFLQFLLQPPEFLLVSLNQTVIRLLQILDFLLQKLVLLFSQSQLTPVLNFFIEIFVVNLVELGLQFFNFVVQILLLLVVIPAQLVDGLVLFQNLRLQRLSLLQVAQILLLLLLQLRRKLLIFLDQESSLLIKVLNVLFQSGITLTLKRNQVLLGLLQVFLESVNILLLHRSFVLVLLEQVRVV